MIRIYDVNGELMESLLFPDTHGFVEWHTKDVQAGLYIYSLGYERHVLESGQILIVK